MLVQCPGCRELVTLAVFEARDGALTFTCGACGRPQHVVSGINPPLRAATTLPPPRADAHPPAPAPAVDESPTLPSLAPPAAQENAGPPLPEETRNLRSGAPAPTKRSAPAVDAVPPDAGAAPPPSAPPALWDAWVTLCGKWTSISAHDAFIASCAAADALPFAGLRYRDHLAAHPGEPMATRGRERVIAQAMIIAQARTEARRPMPQADGANMKVLTWVVAAAAAVGATYMFLDARRQVKELEATTPADGAETGAAPAGSRAEPTAEQPGGAGH